MNSRGLLAMSQKELKRYEVIKRVCEEDLPQGKAGEMLKLSIRQIKRLCQAYRQLGATGLINKARGKPSNRQLSREIQERIISLAKTSYLGFGPTFMSEKLLERDKIQIGKEALRQLLIAQRLWKPKREKTKTVHQRRERRPCFGELIQIDGSPHDWFEGRGPKCCLIVFIDDATSKILYLRFEAQETTQAYFRGTLFVIQTYGLPMSFYSDKHGIFRVNQTDDPEAQTQFGRACETLGIELINAHSPQAKGRVERSNRTFQDRLVKELRLANISTMEAANEFLEKRYRDQHNEHFSEIPEKPESAFIKNHHTLEELNHILSEQAVREASKNLEISFENQVYQIQNEGKGRRLQQSKITVCRTINDEIELFHKNRKLSYKVFKPVRKKPSLQDEKSLNAFCDGATKKAHKPAASHPWRKSSGFLPKADRPLHKAAA